MKNGFVLSCSVFALLFVPACGGDTPAPAPARPAAAEPAPSPAAKPPEPVAGKPEPKTQEPASAAKKPIPPVRIDYEMVKRVYGLEPSATPFDNPPTPEKEALGKALFHEQHLSKNGNLSCASCHDLANYGQDGKPKSTGGDGKPTDRNTPSVWNSSRQFAQFWDARAATVEDQALVHVLSPGANGLADEAELVKKIREKPEIVAAFAKAFPGAGEAVTGLNFGLAIGAFERTLVTKSRFDAYLDGDGKALTNEEKLGLKNFMLDVGCMQCHTGRLVSLMSLQKLGVIKPYASEDLGRAKITGSDADKHLFKVPSLLNVEKTAPYFHDGKVATLEEAVANMAMLQLGKALTPEQLSSIVAFLKTLTGPLPAAK